MSKGATPVETRNGCEIESYVKRVVGLKSDVTMYKVLTTSKPNRIIADGLMTLAEARAAADKEPAQGS